MIGPLLVEGAEVVVMEVEVEATGGAALEEVGTAGEEGLRGAKDGAEGAPPGVKDAAFGLGLKTNAPAVAESLLVGALGCRPAAGETDGDGACTGAAAGAAEGAGEATVVFCAAAASSACFAFALAGLNGGISAMSGREERGFFGAKAEGVGEGEGARGMVRVAPPEGEVAADADPAAAVEEEVAERVFEVAPGVPFEGFLPRIVARSSGSG